MAAHDRLQILLCVSRFWVHDFFFFPSPAEIQAVKKTHVFFFHVSGAVVMRQHSYVVSVQSKSTQRESAGLADS